MGNYIVDIFKFLFSLIAMAFDATFKAISLVIVFILSVLMALFYPIVKKWKMRWLNKWYEYSIAWGPGKFKLASAIWRAWS